MSKNSTFVDDRAHRRADHHVEHLVADGDEGVLDDLDRDRVMGHAGSPAARTRW